MSCTTATGCQPNCSYQIYHIISHQFVTVDHTLRLGQHSITTTQYIHFHDVIDEFDCNFYLVSVSDVICAEIILKRNLELHVA